MIVLFTDFGWQGPYVGQMKAVLFRQAPGCNVIDLMHDAPYFNSRASAYLLASSVQSLPQDSVVIAVVDPGVGSPRRGVVLRADYRWYVGPDNGLLSIVAERAKSKHWYEIRDIFPEASASFHGRDIFAPVAARLYIEEEIEHFLSPIDPPNNIFETDVSEIIYVDHFGNLMTGIRHECLNASQQIRFKGKILAQANTFSDVKSGQSFFYKNSQGLIEIATNSGSAQLHFAAEIGDSVEII